MLTVIAHADWSGARARPQSKRWLAVARRNGRGWRLDPPERVVDPGRLVARLAEEAGAGSALLGLDLPIGLPIGFVRAAGFADPGFLSFLDRIDNGQFLVPAARLDEVSFDRPFFPAGAVRGSGLKTAFLARLQLDPTSLLRRCDRRGETVREACGLFWTVGGNQVGKAAISGWRELLLPARRSATGVLVWPFDGDVGELTARGRVVLAETYPAEAYVRAGLELPSRKRRQDWRAAQAGAIIQFAHENHIEIVPELDRILRDGFGKGGDGEDPFDAVLGILGMAAVADGRRADMPPLPPEIRMWEGWMLGRLDYPA